MHFEILIEDQSGKKALEIIVPQLIGDEDTYKIYPYKGIGRIPKNLGKGGDPKNRILLDQLPRLLRGYGNTFVNYPEDYGATVVLVCDLDDKSFTQFRQELFAILGTCNPRPETRFCIAIEEGEAWLLGDIPAIETAYPNAMQKILSSYVNDSVCGTWEHLANALFAGGARSLSAKGWHTVGKEKSEWSKTIAPHMDVDNNASDSFCYFRDTIRELST